MYTLEVYVKMALPSIPRYSGVRHGNQSTTLPFLRFLEPGFGQAAELVAWWVPKGATVVVEGKAPKTIGLQR